MSDENTEETTEPTVSDGTEAGADQVKVALDEEHEQGFRGNATDSTPNHAYTVAGVLAGEETPESKASKAE